MNISDGSALLCIDFINEIVHPDGKLAGKGYAAFVERNATLGKVAELQQAFRAKSRPVIHVRVGFSASYLEHSNTSKLFGRAKEFGALTLGTWATEFHADVIPLDGEMVITKPRVSAFYATPLEVILRSSQVLDLYVCGVATDLAVQSAAKDAHDRDYKVIVVTDCCAAASEEDHTQSLRLIEKVSTLESLS